jgi:GNAT superfamily N-acetyltransferase
MPIRTRPASSTDSPTLQHIEHGCRTANTFLPPEMYDPGKLHPRNWRAWMRSEPPFDRHPTPRKAFLAYQHSDIMGFVACMHDSLFGGYQADIAGLFVLPKFRRQGVGTILVVKAAQWLQEDCIDRMTVSCYAHDPSRTFFDRLGGVAISTVQDDSDVSALITYGFVNVKELAARAV